jgi:A/G-specific adenine glycosylase
MLSTTFVSEFQQLLLQWQLQCGRHDLPWQQTRDPYAILVSELMLQQTQVATVIPYFQRWMQAFPDVQALAAAADDQVMALWQGLGYYARARNLQKAARYLADLPQWPDTYEKWLAVPGVGPYTAGAIMSFAFDGYGPIVDGNVRRFYSRCFGLDAPVGSSALDKALWQYARLLTPPQSRGFSQALLDMGATLCKAKNPQCEICPVAKFCVALEQQRVAQLPTAKVKKAIPTKLGHFLWLQQDDCIWLTKRADSGIWSSLWCLPEFELTAAATEVGFSATELTAMQRQLAQGAPSLAADVVQEVSASYRSTLLHGRFSHQFSHYKLDAYIWQRSNATSPGALVLPKHGQWVKRSELEQYGLPAPIKQYLIQQ